MVGRHRRAELLYMDEVQRDMTSRPITPRDIGDDWLAGIRLTPHTDPCVDNAVASLVREVTLRVQNIMREDLRTLLLIGGFGRGEGGVMTTSQGIEIANDLDFVIIPRGSGLLGWYKHRARIASAAEELAVDLGVKQVDFGFKNAWMLRRPALTVANYEIAEGHVVLLGDLPPINRQVYLEGRALPTTEGTVYFINRGVGLLIARLYIGDGENVSTSDRQNFNIECQKAILAVGDAILIERSLYHYSYHERGRRLRDIDLSGIVDGERIRALYLSAIEHKLHPDGTPCIEGTALSWWHHIANIFCSFFVEYEARRLGRSFRDLNDYAMKVPTLWRVGLAERGIGLLRTVGRANSTVEFLLRRAWRQARVHYKTSMAQVLSQLLHARLQPGIDDDALEHAERVIQLRADGSVEQRWQMAANKFLLMCHPGGAAGEVARRAD